MACSVEKIIRSIGPCLSSAVTKELVDGGINADTARQRISRASGAVKRLEGIKLPNREKFLFIDKDYGKLEFIENLADALEECRSAYGQAIAGLRARGGSVNAAQFPIASGLPVTNAKGKLLHNLVEQKLEQLHIISREITPDGEFLSLFNGGGINASRRSTIIVEDILLTAIRSWLIKVGWSSSKALKTRCDGKNPQFGQFAWDIVGPSYLNCLTVFENGSPQNGFIVGDIILDRRLSIKDIAPFLSKWESLRAQRRKHRFQPMIIAESFELDALNELRKRGALLCIPSVLFGEELMKDLWQLKTTIEHAAAAVSSDPHAVFTLLSRLSKIEGASLNLRGVVIEMMIAHLYKLNGYSIEIRNVVRDKDLSPAEIDVMAYNKKEIVCCECKGKASHVLVNATEIQDWLDRSLVRIKSWLKDQPPRVPDKRRFEFYSSSGYTEDARILIAETGKKHRKQPIKFYEGRDVVEMLRCEKETALVDIFKEQFLSK